MALMKLKKSILVLPQLASVRLNKQTIMKDSAWIVRLEKAFRRWRFFFRRYNVRHFLWKASEDIRELSLDQNIKKTIISQCLGILSNGTDLQKYFVVSLCYLAGLLNKELCQSILLFALETKNQNIRYWTTMVISEASFVAQDSIYDGFYNDRKKLLKIIAIEGNYSFGESTRDVASKKTICIMTYLLSKNPLNSSQRVSMQLVNGIKNRYDDIHVVCMDSMYINKKESHDIYSASVWSNHSSVAEKSEILKLYNYNSIKLYIAEGNHRERFQKCLNYIDLINPYLILDMTDECSPISYLYSGQFPTVYIPLRADLSSSYFGAIVSPKWKNEEIRNDHKEMLDGEVIDWCFPELIPEIETELRRSDFGFSDDDFIVISVGDCSSCKNDFADEIASLLNKISCMKWFIVGGNVSQYLIETYPKLVSSGSIVTIGYNRHLRELCELCNVHLRMDVTGGSGATAIAAISGLPIAMTDHLCDCMRWLGRDYSLVDNYHDLMNYIEKLYNDPYFYEAQSCRAKNKALGAMNTKEKWLDFIMKIDRFTEGCKN